MLGRVRGEGWVGKIDFPPPWRKQLRLGTIQIWKIGAAERDP